MSVKKNTLEEVYAKLRKGEEEQKKWADVPFSERAILMMRVSNLLKKDKQSLSRLISVEMGKPIAASDAEIEKCALVCEYYAHNTENILKEEMVLTEALSSYVRFDPLGVILAIMPWNFPFWQVFRFAAPALMGGNAGILKHASNVTGCSLAIEKLFLEAGFPPGIFQSIIVHSSLIENIISHPAIKAVTLTGSNEAGAQVASTAGKHIKKTVLELGGSDPFIVFPDADIKKAAETGVSSRLIASGQSCIAAKRFIVHSSVIDQFVSLAKTRMEGLIVGDPLSMKTQVGPLSSQQALDAIESQVNVSIKRGAQLISGGKKITTKEYFYSPTILTQVKKGMPVYDEETFGPVMAVISFNSPEEALSIANDTIYGLGASLWTQDKKIVEDFTKKIESGCIFVNSLVKSDPRLPFGGIKASGYGRELSSYGIKEFVNIKTVWIEK